MTISPTNEIDPREILDEYDKLIIDFQISGMSKEQATEKAKLFQREKYKQNTLSSENT